MKKCELCKMPARSYCESDQASLCWDCDSKVHGANFLVARHSRSLLCHTCQSVTPWKASGSKLGHTVSVCERCANHNQANDNQERGSEAFHDDDDDVLDTHGDDEDDGSDDGGDEDDDDGDGDNQVVPWTSTTPPPALSSSSSSTTCTSSSEEECNDDGEIYESANAFSLKRHRQNCQTSSTDLESLFQEDIRLPSLKKGCGQSSELTNQGGGGGAEASSVDYYYSFRGLKERRVGGRREDETEGVSGSAGILDSNNAQVRKECEGVGGDDSSPGNGSRMI